MSASPESVGLGAAIAGAGMKLGGFFGNMSQRSHELNMVALNAAVSAHHTQQLHHNALELLTAKHLMDVHRTDMDEEAKARRHGIERKNDAEVATSLLPNVAKGSTVAVGSVRVQAPKPKKAKKEKEKPGSTVEAPAASAPEKFPGATGSSELKFQPPTATPANERLTPKFSGR